MFFSWKKSALSSTCHWYASADPPLCLRSTSAICSFRNGA